MLLAPVFGPPLGGFLTTWLGWPSIFYINMPAGLVTILLALRWLPAATTESKPFDSRGFLLNGCALAPLLWGLSELASPGRSHLPAIAALAVGLTVVALALRHA
jgi:MFS family permease